MNKFFLFIILLSSSTLIWISANFMLNSKPTTPKKEATTSFEPEFGSALETSLVDLSTMPTNLCIELRYASKNNFTGDLIYPSSARAFLHEDTADKLMAANEEFYKLGYRIKVWDAYRPQRYQYTLAKSSKELFPNISGYIADPTKGSNHNRGAAIDLTLTDLTGRELDMPTDFDSFSANAASDFDNCTQIQKENRELLKSIMLKHGFVNISNEWWHFDDANYINYNILDVDFKALY